MHRTVVLGMEMGLAMSPASAEDISLYTAGPTDHFAERANSPGCCHPINENIPRCWSCSNAKAALDGTRSQ